MAKSKSGPTRPSSRVGRPSSAEQGGRYTRPIPRSVRRSSRAFGITVLVLLLSGFLLIILNYLNVLPGGASTWYLVAGLVVVFAGCILATRYR